MAARHAAVLTLLVLTGLIATLLSADSGRAFYGDPRFFSGQAPSRLVHNLYPGQFPTDEFLLTVSQQDYSEVGFNTFMNTVIAGLDMWYTPSLNTAPNNITKYPIHFLMLADPNANVIVHLDDAATVDANCPYDFPVAGCNDGEVNGTNDVWIDKAQLTKRLVAHELGHSLRFTDQYYSDGHCANGQQATPTAPSHGTSHANYGSIMDCESAILETPDETDFRTRYEPFLQNANPTFPYTQTSVWSALYQIGYLDVIFPASEVEFQYYWNQSTDTNGSFLADGYTLTDQASRQFTYGVGSRYCVFQQIHNTVGYPANRSWSPRSQYSCIGAPQSQSAGFLLATSDRASATSNTLYIRIKNFAGGTRNVGVFAHPSLANIGCGYANINNGATRQCAVTLARGAYAQLAWYAFDGSGNFSWGYLDFE